MVRSRRLLEVIERDRLFDRAASVGSWFLAELQTVTSRYRDLVSNVRGRGLMCAFDLPDAGKRDAVVTELRERERVLVLPCGPTSIRFRPALTIGEDELARALTALDRCMARLPRPAASAMSHRQGEGDDV
jgi:L-lysine 6-transaminase